MRARIVHERGYVNKRLNFEDVAEYEYSPVKCRKTYRMVVVRKNISRMKGDLMLMDELRYFFCVTTRRDIGAADVVRLANARCNQENVIAQLKGWRQRAAAAGPRSREQLGLHADGGAGV